MREAFDDASSDVCPFIDDNDAACASHFRLDRLTMAFDACVGGYRQCPHYYRLAHRSPTMLITITSHGRALLPTGS